MLLLAVEPGDQCGGTRVDPGGIERIDGSDHGHAGDNGVRQGFDLDIGEFATGQQQCGPQRRPLALAGSSEPRAPIS